MTIVNQIVQRVGSGASSLTNSITRSISGIAKDIVPNNGNFTSLAGGLDPKDSRLATAGFIKRDQPQTPSVRFGGSDYDWRVRISISPSSKILYWDPDATGNVPGLVAPLKQTDGFIFPYVPNITVAHTANYNSVSVTHSNYAQFFYENSSVASISISADFTVQNLDEARYFLAGIYYFRALTKMFYGLTSDYQGSPPPIVYLDGYGQHYLPHVPCVITNFSHTMREDVDYIEISTPQSVNTSKPLTETTGQLGTIKLPAVSGTNATENGVITQTINNAVNRVPTASVFNITLQPIISRTQAIGFNYKDFAKGGLIGSKAFPGGYL